jgi:formyltetrahydrofolate synthetase
MENPISKQEVKMMYDHLVSIGCENPTADNITFSLWENEEGFGTDLTEEQFYEIVLPFVKLNLYI